jgi:hypothetical protein
MAEGASTASAIGRRRIAATLPIGKQSPQPFLSAIKRMKRIAKKAKGQIGSPMDSAGCHKPLDVRSVLQIILVYF